MSIKFTIAIPAFKAKFLAECIGSVLGQTYKDFEMVIVNDASPQCLDAVVNQYHDDRIKYYKNKKGFGVYNVVGNWNKCLEYATGDYIICMGDDDKLLPTCLENYAKLIEQYPDVDVLHTRVQMIDENSKVFKYQEYRPLKESVYSLIYWRWKGRSQFIGDFLYKVSTLRKNGGFYNLPCAWGADDISAVIAAKGHGIINMQEYGFQYRMSRYTISNGGSYYKDKCLALKLQHDWYASFLQESKPSDDEDKVYWHLLAELLNKHYTEVKKICIIQDMKHNRISELSHWLVNKGKYSIDNKLVLKSFIKSFSNA